MMDTIKLDSPSNTMAKSKRSDFTSTVSGINIDIIEKTHAKISVVPVVNNVLISFGSIFVAFNELTIPLGLEPAELKIEIAANTNPKSIPATVDITPATVRISTCGIGFEI
ncbi:hypothetical protein C1Y41_05825 [Pantoea sp. ICBG 1758]|nr:hypothetical protein C1Y41_05825 [Pantoea sp. ICBG 1758]